MGVTEQLVVDLPSELVAALRKSVQSGTFASESEALEILLRGWYGAAGIEEPDIETLRAFVGEGMADANAGRLVDAEAVYTNVRERVQAVASKKST